MSFDWWHPECTATCFIIVTVVENHRLAIQLFMSVCINNVIVKVICSRKKIKNCFKLY